MPNLEAIKNQLFIGPAFCVVQRFSQYHTRVEQLPADEQRKILTAADFVINSISEPRLTGGVVVMIGVRGHADVDLLKFGATRLAFEQQVSEERAKEVASALMTAIKTNAYKLAVKSPPSGEPYVPVIEGMGARMLLRSNPLNEGERSLNRRAEIFLLRDWASIVAAGDFGVPPQKSFRGVA